MPNGTSPDPRRLQLLGRTCLIAALAAATATTALLPAPASAGTLPVNPNWQQYVQGPTTPDVSPVKVVSASGDVANPGGLADPSLGPTTLTMRAGGPAPVLLLDYGKDIGGLPYFNVASVSGTPTLQAGYSEAQQFAGPQGDSPVTSFMPRAGLDPVRDDQFPLAAPRLVSGQLVQGGQRFEYLTLTQPGTVTLSSVGFHFTPYRATPDKYQGYFVSSDDQLNRIWYAGAYTAQLDMVPTGTPDGGLQPVVYDGAKRDRLIWAGDLAQTIPAIATSLGGNGAEYVKQSLAVLAQSQNPSDGSMPGYALPNGPGVFYSTAYSAYYVLDLGMYYRYTGDLAFAQQQYPAMQRELAYDQSLVAPTTGLLTIPSGGTCSVAGSNASAGCDWDYYDGAKTGAVTEFNVLYYRALTEGADVADALGYHDTAYQYRQQAAVLRGAINTWLFNPSTGVYDISDTLRGSIAQDANAAAVLYGVAPADKVPSILAVLKQKLWIPTGSLPYSPDAGYSNLVSPFIGGFEAAARFANADTDDALALLRSEWGTMVAPGPQYTGAFWENLAPDGTPPSGVTSLAHGWSAGPTAALTGYLLGIQPLAGGYRTWTIAPHPGDVAWAQGQEATAFGPIGVNWARNSTSFTLQATVPNLTSGTIAIPLADPAASTVSVNGAIVWKKGQTPGSAPGIARVDCTAGAIVLTVSDGGTYSIQAS